MKTTAAQNESVNEQPRVSVILPCYSLMRSPDEAVDSVDSVLSQTFLDCEIIIVTSECAMESHFPRTRVITSEKQSRSAMCNLGVQSAVGQYICVMEADDRLDALYLQKAIQILDGDPSVAVVSAWLRISAAEEQLWKPDQLNLAALLCERTVARAALVRKAALEEVGGYDEKIPIPDLEEWDLWVSLIEKGFEISIIPEILVYRGKHVNSARLVDRNAEAHLGTLRYFVEKHGESYRKNLFDILLSRESEMCELLKAGYAMERYLATSLEPLLRSKKQEVERLQQKLELAIVESEPAEGGKVAKAINQEQEQQIESLETALRDAQQEIRGLRNSISWRITAPLRAVYDFLFGQR